jgi:hypothetical protein
MDLAICYNMGEPGGHYAKWNKPDTKKNAAWSHLHVHLKNSQIYRENKIVVGE